MRFGLDVVKCALAGAKNGAEASGAAAVLWARCRTSRGSDGMGLRVLLKCITSWVSALQLPERAEAQP